MLDCPGSHVNCEELGARGSRPLHRCSRPLPTELELLASIVRVGLAQRELIDLQRRQDFRLVPIDLLRLLYTLLS